MRTGSINVQRVIQGGIIAAIVQFLAWVLIFGWMLPPDALVGKEGQIHGTESVLWITLCLVNGLTGVWIYAGIRPRYGAGPKTALIAGLMLWLASGAVSNALAQIPGDTSRMMVVVGAVGGLIASLIAIVAGASVYKEAE